RAIDQLRRRQMAERRQDELGRRQEREHATSELDMAAAADDEIGDDMLSLLFATCHPMLSAQARAALTLRLFGGLSTLEIARAFLVSEATVAQRVVRAKRTLAEARVPLEVPSGAELAPRLASVLEVIYLIFNEGYSATAGEDWMRPALCEDALRMGRILAELLPRESEVHGLVALMEIQASRLLARTDSQGKPVLLLDQNRALWDRLLIQRGLAALERAVSLGGALGPYALQAAIAACHARAATPEQTDWGRIVALYDALAQLSPSPVVELNRAVAVSMAYGPEAALELVDALAGASTLSDYHLLPSVRADLLARLGRVSEARAELARAVALTQNESERRMLSERAAGLLGAPGARRPPLPGRGRPPGASSGPRPPAGRLYGAAGAGGANSPAKSAAASGSPSTRSAPSRIASTRGWPCQRTAASVPVSVAIVAAGVTPAPA
ncbi:MAG: RNA polymerase sigma factor, partial [Solirubrobacteraceae bacterium]